MTSAALVWGLVLAGAVLVAHEPLVSPYTFVDVRPIFRERCGACHYPGGPAPMSLLTYGDARPWAAAIRAQLTGETMPPWFADRTGPAVIGGHQLPTRELDMLVTWASGGTPEGEPATAARGPGPAPSWSAGAPDLVLDVPSVTLAAGETDDIKAFSIGSGLTEDMWVRGVDVLPSDPSIVRDVTVATERGDVLAAWVPGERMVPVPDGTAFLLPARTPLKVAVRYRKRWQDAQAPRTEQTRIGLYRGARQSADGMIRTETFDDSLALTRPTRVLAVRPVLHDALDAVHVQATLPGGDTVALLALRSPRPGWSRRYWLANPVDLPPGTVVAVLVSGDNPTVELTTTSR